MSKAALVEVVRRNLERNTSVAEAKRIVAAVIEAVKQGVSETRSARLLGFGTFKMAVRKARMGVNPRPARRSRWRPVIQSNSYLEAKRFESKSSRTVNGGQRQSWTGSSKAL